MFYECDRYREKILDEIDRLKPEIVIIAQAANYTPIGPGGSAVRSDEERIVALAQGERAFIRRVTATGASLVMIADTPWLPEDPVGCLLGALARQDFAAGRVMKSCEIDFLGLLVRRYTAWCRCN